MINRFALSLLCIELDRNDIYGVMRVFILLICPRGKASASPLSRFEFERIDLCNHLATGQ